MKRFIIASILLLASCGDSNNVAEGKEYSISLYQNGRPVKTYISKDFTVYTGYVKLNDKDIRISGDFVIKPIKQ